MLSRLYDGALFGSRCWDSDARRCMRLGRVTMSTGWIFARFIPSSRLAKAPPDTLPAVTSITTGGWVVAYYPCDRGEESTSAAIFGGPVGPFSQTKTVRHERPRHLSFVHTVTSVASSVATSHPLWRALDVKPVGRMAVRVRLEHWTERVCCKPQGQRFVDFKSRSSEDSQSGLRGVLASCAGLSVVPARPS